MDEKTHTPGSASGLLRSTPPIGWPSAVLWRELAAGETDEVADPLVLLREGGARVRLVHAPEGLRLTGPLTWAPVPCDNARAAYDRVLIANRLRAPRTRSASLTKALLGVVRHTPLAPLSPLARPLIGRALYDEMFRPEEARKPGLVALRRGEVRIGGEG